jgi:hypothetical protein
MALSHADRTGERKSGGYRVPATAELSGSVASRQCPRRESQVSGEHVQADRSRQGERHRVIVNVAPGIAVKPFDWPYPRPEAMFNVRHRM